MQQVLLQALQKVRVWISMTEKSEIEIRDIVDNLAVDSKKKTTEEAVSPATNRRLNTHK